MNFGEKMAVFDTQIYVLNIDEGTCLYRPNHAMVKPSGSGVRQASTQQTITHILSIQ